MARNSRPKDARHKTKADIVDSDIITWLQCVLYLKNNQAGSFESYKKKAEALIFDYFSTQLTSFYNNIPNDEPVKTLYTHVAISNFLHCKYIEKSPKDFRECRRDAEELVNRYISITTASMGGFLMSFENKLPHLSKALNSFFQLVEWKPFRIGCIILIFLGFISFVSWICTGEWLPYYLSALKVFLMN